MNKNDFVEEYIGLLIENEIERTDEALGNTGRDARAKDMERFITAFRAECASNPSMSVDRCVEQAKKVFSEMNKQDKLAQQTSTATSMASTGRLSGIA